MYQTEFGQVVARIIESLGDRLPADDRRDFHSALDAGEWAFLANALAATLVDEQISITSTERDNLRFLLYWFKDLPKPNWRRIPT